jgi:hypothetical protein
MLVDSNTNEPLSHGYIKFQISPKDSLLPNSRISNKANIYFDYNPAIITNEVYNRIECYDTSKANISFVDGNTLSTDFINASFYYWYFNDSLIQASPYRKLNAVDTGIYKLAVLDSNACLTPISKDYFHQPNSLHEKNLLFQDISLHPNPSAGIATIKILSREENFPIELKIYSVQGKAIKKHFIVSNLQQIDLRKLPKGLYFLNFNFNESILTKKLILE